MAADWDWIVSFKGRNYSGFEQQNFRCRSGNVFVMDNHRAALWCWLQCQDLSKPHSLIHIDRHNDTLQSQMSEWLANLPSWRSGINEYLGAEYSIGTQTCSVIRWDNYLSIYFEEFSASLKELRFVTHAEGDKPNYDGTQFSQPWDLPENLAFWLDINKPWIVNIDIDYFYCCAEGSPIQMFSDFYFDRTFLALKQAMDNGTVAALTLCLTPDTYTPGWDAAEALAIRGLRHLGLKWELPKQE